MTRMGKSAGRWIGSGVLAVAMVSAGAGLPISVPPVEAAGGQSLNLGLGVSSLYDDNILQYSDAQLLVFDSGLKPAQFSINSSDDLLLKPSASLTWENAMGRRRSRSVRLRFGGEFHKENATADFRSYSAQWRESFSKDRRLSLSGFWLPGFYLRQLYDEDFVPALPGFSKYRRTEFDLGIGSISWRQRIAGKTRAEIGYQYEHRAYNQDFLERTSSTHQGEFGVEWYRLPSRGSLNVHGGYRASNAKAVDADGIADDPDVSYHGPIAGLGWRMELARGNAWRLGADLGYELGKRSYTSSLASDKYHQNRDDTSSTVDFGLRYSLPPHWALRGLYRFDHNSAKLGSLAPPTSDTGSYTENQVGLAVEWSSSVWRQSKESTDQEGEQ